MLCVTPCGMEKFNQVHIHKMVGNLPKAKYASTYQVLSIHAVTVFIKLVTWSAEHWAPPAKFYDALSVDGIDVASITDLASKLGDPEILAKCVVEVLNVSDERLRISAVPVESNGINLEKINLLELSTEERNVHGNRRRRRGSWTTRFCRPVPT